MRGRPMEKQVDREKLEALRKKIKKQKYTSILLALFTLGVNIFAWFAFSANAGLQLDATVASWDVEFKDNSGRVARNILIEVTKMKPGMTDFKETVEVDNNSDVEASFSYEYLSFSLLGRTIDLSGISDVDSYLANYYPFALTITPSKNMLSGNDSLTVDVDLVWPYETLTPTYFAQNNVYDFNDSFIYYSSNSGVYTEATVADSTAFESQKANLFLEKDDADTYFGMACANYEATTGDPCLSLSMRLLVEQIDS